MEENEGGTKRVQSSTHNDVKITAQHQVKPPLLGYQSTLPTNLLGDGSSSDVFEYTINKVSQPFVNESLDPSTSMLYDPRTSTLLAYTKKIIPNVDTCLIHTYSIYILEAHYTMHISCVMPASFTSASVRFTIPTPLQSWRKMVFKLRHRFSRTANVYDRLLCDDVLVACNIGTDLHASGGLTGETRTSLVYLSTERTKQLGLQWSNNAGAVRSMVGELSRP